MALTPGALGTELQYSKRTESILNYLTISLIFQICISYYVTQNPASSNILLITNLKYCYEPSSGVLCYEETMGTSLQPQDLFGAPEHPSRKKFPDCLWNAC